MTENTNQNTPVPEAKDGLLDDLANIAPETKPNSLFKAATDAPTSSPEGDTSAVPATPATDATSADKKAKDKDTESLDLSGLASTIDSFASNKDKTKKIDFSVKSPDPQKDKAMHDALFERSFLNKVTKLTMLCLVFIVLAVFGYVFQQYIKYIGGGNVSNSIEVYMPSFHKAYVRVNRLFGQNPYKYGIDSFTTATAKNTLNTIISDRSLNYIMKRESLIPAVDQLSKSTITQFTRLDEVKQDIGSYGFFPKNVQQFAASTFIDNSLQKSLLAVEAIRFSTALTFFSNLDTFIQQFSSFVSINPTQLSTILEAYKSRGEKDIQNYLTTCYFNPYVNADNCSMPQGNDFANYYTYVDTKSTIDRRVFPILMSYLDSKLEESDFPSLEINIKSFDPLQNNISFGIDLNTFQEDELQLLNRWILNPHIYLATKIINLLRESKFIVAEPINLTTLKVNKKKLRIGSQEFTVNNSTFDFTLPLQKNAEREIYDFDQRQQ